MGRVALPARIAIDTTLFLYLFDDEGSALREIVRDQVFGPVLQGHLSAVTSVVTLAEVLVRPLRDGNTSLVSELIESIHNYPNLRIVDLDSAIAVRAAEVRMATRLALPDAIHIATALETGTEAFVTNDHTIRARVTSIPVVLVPELTD